MSEDGRRLFDPIRFGELILHRMKQERLSLREVQHRTGVDHAIVHRVTEGKPPNIENFCRLAQWLDLAVDKYIDPL